MDSKVYYGEYSLKHWIDLILSGNIKLPKYQRSFVWKKDAVQDFIKSLKNKEFIPPVIIGSFENKFNYIIDGQQRLTSLLLAYIGKIPKPDEFKASDLTQYADADDSIPDDDVDDEPISWTFSLLITDGNNTKDLILETIEKDFNGKYEDLDTNLTQSELEDTYLGFSFIVPAEEKKDMQQKFYCSVFRNINRKGTALLPQESRRSLYFLDDSKKEFFDWQGFIPYKIENKGRARSIDFIRYISITSQYAKDGNTNNIMAGFSPRGGNDEIYYEYYISEAIGDSVTKIFKIFNEIFPNSDFKTRLDNFSKLLKDLSLNKKYNSIIETDIVFFGLIYHCLICDKKIDASQKDELKNKIQEKILEYENTSDDDNRKQKKNPNTLKYIRRRLQDSIEIYNLFVMNRENA